MHEEWIIDWKTQNKCKSNDSGTLQFLWFLCSVEAGKKKNDAEED